MLACWYEKEKIVIRNLTSIIIHSRHYHNILYIIVQQLDEELIVPQRIGGVHRGRPMSDAEGYQPIDFSSLPIGPDFDLVNGMFILHHAICMLLRA